MGVIVLDFDGTCVEHEFPYIGEEIGAVPVLKRLVQADHKLVLFTMRSNHDKSLHVGSEEYPDVMGGNYLNDALKWFKTHGIPLYGVQTNPEQKSWTTSPKAYGHLIIDDVALGCPLVYDKARPYVDWVEVEKWLERNGWLPKNNV